MQGQHHYQPELFSQINYEQLIPKSHLLRKIDKVLDLSFLPELTVHLYAHGLGRPSIDPTIFVRMVVKVAHFHLRLRGGKKCVFAGLAKSESVRHFYL